MTYAEDLLLNGEVDEEVLVDDIDEDVFDEYDDDEDILDEYDDDEEYDDDDDQIAEADPEFFFRRRRRRKLRKRRTPKLRRGPGAMRFRPGVAMSIRRINGNIKRLWSFIRSESKARKISDNRLRKSVGKLNSDMARNVAVDRSQSRSIRRNRKDIKGMKDTNLLMQLLPPALEEVALSPIASQTGDGESVQRFEVTDVKFDTSTSLLLAVMSGGMGGGLGGSNNMLPLILLLDKDKKDDDNTTLLLAMMMMGQQR